MYLLDMAMLQLKRYISASHLTTLLLGKVGAWDHEPRYNKLGEIDVTECPCQWDTKNKTKQPRQDPITNGLRHTVRRFAGCLTACRATIPAYSFIHTSRDMKSNNSPTTVGHHCAFPIGKVWGHCVKVDRYWVLIGWQNSLLQWGGPRIRVKDTSSIILLEIISDLRECWYVG